MPLVMNILLPLTTHSSPSRRAVVFRLATSEPPVGSVMARAEIFSPERTWGMIRSLIAWLPSRRIGGRPMPWLIRLALTPPAPWRAPSPLGAVGMKGGGAPPAVLLRPAQPQQANLRGLPVELAGKLAGLVPVIDEGHDLRL